MDRGEKTGKRQQRLNSGGDREEVARMTASLEPGHIVATLVAEHEALLQLLVDLDQVSSAIRQMERFDGDRAEFARLTTIANYLTAAELHHQREEEVLFPELEKRGVSGPPAAMREEHTRLRGHKYDLSDLADHVAGMDFDEFKSDLEEIVRVLVPMLREHIFKENSILYPAALKIVADDQVWCRLKEACDRIGYFSLSPK